MDCGGAVRVSVWCGVGVFGVVCACLVWCVLRVTPRWYCLLQDGDRASQASYHKTPDSSNFHTPAATPMDASAPTSNYMILLQ